MSSPASVATPFYIAFLAFLRSGRLEAPGSLARTLD
jgi:hypothetical protein